MDENVPLTVGIIGAVFLGFMMISCERTVSMARIPLDIKSTEMRMELDKEMILKGYHRNGWGSWVKDDDKQK